MMRDDGLSAEQVKAARALLRWSQADLAREAKLGGSTVADFERGHRTPVPANLDAIRRVLEGAGIAFVAGGAVEAGGLSALSGATPTVDDYERSGVSRYTKLAATVASILDAAIKAHPELRCQPAQHRAKDPASLRAKLAKLDVAEGRDLGATVKDLAGCRLVFYSNGDVSRFLHSGIVWDNFDIDWSRTRLHYPGADFNAPDSQFIGNNYVVRLKPDRAALAEYAPVAGLWCEVQVQTILNHAWSAMAHDTIYKRPDLAGIGRAHMEGINARMSKIMRQYLLPAGFEFQKVLNDFNRLAAGKALFDGDVLDQIRDAPDNNRRFELVEAFEETVLPLYDNINEVYSEIRTGLLQTVAVSLETQTRPVETDFGLLDGKSGDDVAERIIKILMRLRYVDIEATFDALAELYLGAKSEVARAQVLKAAAEFAKPDLAVWRQHGPIVQVRLVERIDALDDSHRALLGPLVREIYGAALDPEVRGTSSTSSAITISTGSVLVSDALKIMRRRALEGLFEQYRTAVTDRDRGQVVFALKHGWRMPIRGEYADALLVAVLEDTVAIVDFFVSELPSQSHELKQRLERDLLFLHQRNRGVPQEGEHAASIVAVREQLDEAIGRYREAVNALPAFVAFKTLVGFESVFPPDWRDERLGWEAKEAYRDAQIGDYVAALDGDNADDWFELALCCASVESQDLATFPSFGRFLRRVCEGKPEIGESWLARADGTPLARFMPAFLHGLAKRRPKTTRKIASAALANGRYLPEVLHYLRHAEPPDLGLAKRGVSAAIKHNAAEAVHSALELAVARVVDLGGAEARSIFLDALAYLDRNKHPHWTTIASVWWRKNRFSDVLSDEDLRIVLAALVTVPKIDWHVESLLVDISARAPDDVIALFGRRFAHERALGEDPFKASYEAAPFKLDQLGPALAEHIELGVEQAAAWAMVEPDWARFTTGAFIAKLNEIWSAELEQALWRQFSSGEPAKLKFVLAVLSNYEGAPFIHNLLRDIVAALPDDDELLSTVNIVLQETGVMHGAFGGVEAYRSKVDWLTPWLADERSRVRVFAERILREYENHIAAEQRRAEEDLAMRRLAYDEPPIPPSEAAGDQAQENAS